MPEIVDDRIQKLKKAVVAISGGVDSSFAAYFFKQRGIEVIGVFFKLFPEASEISPYLPLYRQQQNLERARKIAKELEITFMEVDVSAAFEREVIRPFIETYLKGSTPNPCIVCNPGIKFAHLLTLVKETEADIAATGHYARIRPSENFFSLLKVKDRNKDQSYYLYRLTQSQFKQCFLPNGFFSKDEIKKKMSEIIRGIGFEDESQEVCFIEKDYRDFLRKVTPKAINPGYFVLKDGTVVGKHDGIAFYTVGQRKGLGLALGKKMYVIGIDPENNQIILGEESDLYPDGILVESLHFIVPPKSATFICTVKVRYRSPEVKCKVKLLQNGKAEVWFSEKCAFPAPGQSAVFYDGEEVIGGGIISRWL